MTNVLSPRDYLRIQEAAQALGVSEQTLRNWDRLGKLKAQRHPINGYRLYRASELHALLRTLGPGEAPAGETEASGSQLTLDLLATAVDWEQSGSTDSASDSLPPCHWRPEVALDPKHRPQRWDAPSTTVRRDWRKYPQEAYVLDPEARRYRRLTVEEIAILQGFDPSVVDHEGLTNRQRIASAGDAVPPPLAKAVLSAVDSVWTWTRRTAIEICAGIGGLAEGAAHAGLEHEALIDVSPVCGQLLRNRRAWSSDVVHVGDALTFDYAAFRGRAGLLSGGPPCQPWSQSGHRMGQADERDLLGHLDAMVDAVEPEVFVFENVPGLATPANEAYLRYVVERLRRPSHRLRYGVMVGVFNAADFGVPQVRRRLFILGFRDMPSSFAGRCFLEIEARRSHVAPALPRGDRAPWQTVGEAIGERPDPGGWRRWIGVGE